MSKNNLRVIIPREPEKLVELAKRIIKKHEEDGVASPLRFLDMDAFKSNVLEGEKNYLEARQLMRDAEEKMAKGHFALGTGRKMRGSDNPQSAKQIIRSVRDILLGIHKGKEKNLGDSGFDVDDSPRKKKNKKLSKAKSALGGEKKEEIKKGE